MAWPASWHAFCTGRNTPTASCGRISRRDLLTSFISVTRSTKVDRNDLHSTQNEGSWRPPSTLLKPTPESLSFMFVSRICNAWVRSRQVIDFCTRPLQASITSFDCRWSFAAARHRSSCCFVVGTACRAVSYALVRAVNICSKRRSSCSSAMRVSELERPFNETICGGR